MAVVGENAIIQLSYRVLTSLCLFVNMSIACVDMFIAVYLSGAF